jgi:hypothetical protein
MPCRPLLLSNSLIIMALCSTGSLSQIIKSFSLFCVALLAYSRIHKPLGRKYKLPDYARPLFFYTTLPPRPGPSLSAAIDVRENQPPAPRHIPPEL